MRFLSNSPAIPDELLEERDRGNVVFFCGAGVSYPAQMPTFLGLARYVVTELGTPPEAESRSMLEMWNNPDAHPASLPSLDLIFNMLQQEYTPGEIDYYIAKRLKSKPRTDTSAHNTILRLAKGAEDRVQIVTTNFDLLFEKAAGRGLARFSPPALPDIASGQPLDGVVYLHGRIDGRLKRGDGRHGFVVSSSDFGRAYLADGWATRFVRELLDRYIVVLLGYSASDPPVRYLLQGLHTRTHGAKATIYAFDSGKDEEVELRWRDSGVIPLAYPKIDGGHSALWETLSAWAERADDPLSWQESIVKLAQRNPKSLLPHQRGQVASVVRTNSGARLFADADPPPLGEWLCVFDRFVRYGEVGHSFIESAPKFDPFEAYHLDDDPPRPPKAEPTPNPIGDDILTVRPSDNSERDRKRLAGVPQRWGDPLPTRLFQLSRWIARVANEPTTIWWAARYPTIHSELVRQLELLVSPPRADFPSKAHSIWTLLIEKFRNAPDDDVDLRLHSVLQQIRANGWTGSTFRQFRQAISPYLATESHIGLSRAQPPQKEWSELDPQNIVNFCVKFPQIDPESLELSSETLKTVYLQVRDHLELAAGYLADIGTTHWQTSTFYPEEHAGDAYVSDESAYLLWFRDLLDRVAASTPALLKADTTLWPKNEPFIFDKLHLYAWSKNTVFAGEEVASGLLSFSDSSFWNSGHRRELLHLIRKRWNDIAKHARKTLEDRISSGRPAYDGEDPDQFEISRSATSATILGWLKLKGCVLHRETEEALNRLQATVPDWNPQWDERADESLESRVGFVRTDSSPTVLEDASLDQVIALASEHTKRSTIEFTQHKPFDGLVAQHPRKAVAALSYAARKSYFPVEFWSSALRSWPADSPGRLLHFFGERLARLPASTVFELRFEVFRWLEKNFPLLAAKDEAHALYISDRLLDRLLECESDATNSSLGDSTRRGEQTNKSRKTLEHAINSPIGNTAEILLNLLSSSRPAARSKIPVHIRDRLERLFAVTGEGADHAVCVVARQLLWLDYVDPKWVEKQVLPWFNPSHPASTAAWNGFLHSTQLPRPGLFARLKPHFLSAIASPSHFGLEADSVGRLHEFLVLGCLWRRRNRSYISFEEARRAMQQTDNSGRQRCLWFLKALVKKSAEWQTFGRPFLERAWPREAVYQTQQTASAFADLAVEAGEHFPEVVRTVQQYLSPTSRHSLVLYRLTKQGEGEHTSLAHRHPDATLALIDKIVAQDPRQAPHYLSTALEEIAACNPAFRQDGRWRRLRAISVRQ